MSLRNRAFAASGKRNLRDYRRNDSAGRENFSRRNLHDYERADSAGSENYNRRTLRNYGRADSSGSENFSRRNLQHYGRCDSSGSENFSSRRTLRRNDSSESRPETSARSNDRISNSKTIKTGLIPETDSLSSSGNKPRRKNSIFQSIASLASETSCSNENLTKVVPTFINAGTVKNDEPRRGSALFASLASETTGSNRDILNNNTRRMTFPSRKASITAFFQTSDQKKQQAREQAIKNLIKDRHRWNELRQMLKKKNIVTNMAAQEILNETLKEIHNNTFHDKGKGKITKRVAKVSFQEEKCSPPEIERSSSTHDDSNSSVDENDNEASIISSVVIATKAMGDQLFKTLADEKVQEAPKKQRAIYNKSVRHLNITY